MRKRLLVFCCLVLLTGISVARSKKKLPEMQAVLELTKMLTGTGLPFKMLHDSVAVIPYQGENIATYDAIPGKLNEAHNINTCCNKMIILIL